MKKTILVQGIIALLCHTGSLMAHCQMPCGIYHDELVFNQIDQYIETMYKGITELNNSKFSTPFERNNFIRWVKLKDSASDEIANLITEYFLQQKIKPAEADTPKRLISAHKMLFELTAIKQNVNIKMIEAFADEWENFKQMFHVINYECQIDLIKRRKRERDFQLKDQRKLNDKHSSAENSSSDEQHEHSSAEHEHTH
jgi:nickel superoxide dismutase